jgi:uncharacterized membrane protein YtjA (UPF0391 family)
VRVAAGRVRQHMIWRLARGLPSEGADAEWSGGFGLTPFRSWGHRRPTNRKGILMLHYALVFFVIALIAALFGFGGIAAGAAEIAKVLFFIFLVLFIVSLVLGLFRRGG